MYNIIQIYLNISQIKHNQISALITKKLKINLTGLKQKDYFSTSFAEQNQLLLFINNLNNFLKNLEL